MTQQKSKKEQEHELTFKVYQVKGDFTPHGYDKHLNGMIYFSTEYNAYVLNGNPEVAAKEVINHIQIALKKNINLPFINFEYPDISKNIPHYADGFFGRPRIWSDTIILKPLSKGKRDSLSRELNKIGSIQDRKGKTIELRA